MRDRIYEIFVVGERYSKAGIKETLANLYKELGYNKTAKANDLEEYFEISRKCVIIDGKKAEGFEILKKNKKRRIRFLRLVPL